MRNMEEAGCFIDRQRPSWEQLYNKIHSTFTKQSMRKDPPMTNTFQMRDFISQHSEVPQDPNDSYISYHEILDEDASSLRFTIIFTSTTCLAR